MNVCSLLSRRGQCTVFIKQALNLLINIIYCITLIILLSVFLLESVRESYMGRKSEDPNPKLSY